MNKSPHGRKKNDPEFFKTFTSNPEFSRFIFTIDRSGKNPRKDIAKWSEVPEYTEYFYSAPAAFGYAGKSFVGGHKGNT